MASVQIFNDEITTDDLPKIRLFLENQGIAFGTFTSNEVVKKLIVERSPSEEARKVMIEQFPSEIARFSQKSGYRADVVCFYPELSHLEFILNKFGSIHYHFEHEFWYFIDGAARFGFCGKEGTKFEVTVNAGEFLQVPEGIWQWFSLTPEKVMKAIRFFYTDHLVQPRMPVIL
ncbi:MAG TPA: hypothetical protein VJK48_02840 [Chlamydiales bacterium]|nr:MAG: hypothetical protein A3F67_01335 [Verrucomicrobia bacterium RIFCSPHIGHO2_12_FULL_41_10]HLB52630.1 hypothetical protein [Chlamydiales bacterium]